MVESLLQIRSGARVEGCPTCFLHAIHCLKMGNNFMWYWGPELTNIYLNKYRAIVLLESLSLFVVYALLSFLRYGLENIEP